MPKKYKRNCEYCGKYYEGRGKLCCSTDCFTKYINNGGAVKGGRKPHILVNIDGENLTLRQICKKFDLPYSTVRKRYADGKRGIELTKPKNSRHKRDFN